MCGFCRSQGNRRKTQNLSTPLRFKDFLLHSRFHGSKNCGFCPWLNNTDRQRKMKRLVISFLIGFAVEIGMQFHVLRVIDPSDSIGYWTMFPGIVVISLLHIGSREYEKLGLAILFMSPVMIYSCALWTILTIVERIRGKNA
jgi:hypothetical protein